MQVKSKLWQGMGLVHPKPARWLYMNLGNRLGCTSRRTNSLLDPSIFEERYPLKETTHGNMSIWDWVMTVEQNLVWILIKHTNMQN